MIKILFYLQTRGLDKIIMHILAAGICRMQFQKKFTKIFFLRSIFFFSHGHPDHLNPDSIHKFKNNTIILGDHVGKRMFNDLKSQGFNVRILKERVWTDLSKNVSVMSVSTKIQDTILIIKIRNDIFINLNDAGPMNHRFIKKVVKNFKRKFLLSISGWGDADMINFYDKENNFIEPLAAKKHPVGDYLSLIAKLFSANFIAIERPIPFEPPVIINVLFIRLK